MFELISNNEKNEICFEDFLNFIKEINYSIDEENLKEFYNQLSGEKNFISKEDFFKIIDKKIEND